MTTEHIKYIADILAFTEKQIRTHTGITVTLRIAHFQMVGTGGLNPADMLLDMLQAVGVNYEELASGTKKPEMVVIRHACAYVINAHFPNMGPLRISQLFKQDHSTIINALNKAGKRLDDNDEEFMIVYARANQAAERWISKMKEDTNEENNR